MRLGLLIFFLLGCAPSITLAQTSTLQDIADTLETLPEIVIYPAKEIVTLDPERPTAGAAAVLGDRILAVGSLDQLRAAAGKQPYTVNTLFADKVIVPGFIASTITPYSLRSP